MDAGETSQTLSGRGLRQGALILGSHRNLANRPLQPGPAHFRALMAISVPISTGWCSR
jgi:hypothetical protein